jgi:hypothetical protein
MSCPVLFRASPRPNDRRLRQPLPLQLSNHGHVPQAILVQLDEFAHASADSRQFAFAMLRMNPSWVILDAAHNVP